MNTHIIY